MSRLFLSALEKVKSERKRLAFSQLAAGLLIGCTQSQYGKKERGEQQFTMMEYCLLMEAFQAAEKVNELFVL